MGAADAPRLPPLLFGGFLSSLASTVGLPQYVVGGILGIILLIVVLMLLSEFEINGTGILLAIIGVCIVNVLLTLWDSWIIVLIGILAGVLLWKEIASPGSA